MSDTEEVRIAKKNKGIFFAVEGIDGSGKSTITKYVEECLIEAGRSVVRTYEVGGTPIGKEIRKICFSSNPDFEPLDPLSLILLNYAARIQHIRNVIAPNILNGVDVVTDRYNFSTRAYQGILAGMTREMDILEGTTPLRLVSTLPDWTFYLQVSPEVAWERMQQRGKVDNDRYKSSFEQVQKNYEAYEKVMGSIKRGELGASNATSVIYVKADADIDSVKKEISFAIKSILKLHHLG